MPRDSLFARGKTLLLAYTSPGHAQMKTTAPTRDFMRVFIVIRPSYHHGPPVKSLPNRLSLEASVTMPEL
jgi:hypothetical protein